MLLYYARNKFKWIYPQSGQPLAATDFPRLGYQQLVQHEIHVVDVDGDGNLTPVDLATEYAVTAISAALDIDFSSSSAPVCRTNANYDLSRLSEGILTLPWDSDTAAFLAAISGKESRSAYYEIRLFNATPRCVYVIKPAGQSIILDGVVDPDTGDPGDPPSNYYLKAEVDALVTGQVAWTDRPLAVYDATRTYAAGDFCHYGSTLYVSLQAANTGNAPDEEASAYWQAYAGTGTGTAAWDDITGKPSTFTPAAHVHPTSEITDLDTELGDINAELLAQDARLDDLESGNALDIDSLPGKTSAISGEEKLIVSDAGTKKAITTGIFATADHDHDFDVEYGFTKALTADIDNTTHLKPYVAKYNEDEPDAEDNVELLLHFSGSEGSTTVEDKSGNDRTINLTGTAYITELVKKWGSVLKLPNDSVLTVDVPTMTALGAAAWTWSGFVRPTTGQEAAVHDLFRFADSVGNKRAICIYLADEQLHVELGCDGEDNWTDHLQYDVAINPDEFNHALVQRNGAELVIAFNGEILDRYNIGSRVINSPETATWKMWIGDDGSGVYMDGYLDEIIFARSALVEIGEDDETYTVPGDWYITRERALDERDGMYYGTFTNDDLVDNVLTIVHGLGREVVHCVIADETKEELIPDRRWFVGDTTVKVDLSSFAPLSGTWTISILAWAIAANALGSAVTQDDIDALQDKIDLINSSLSSIGGVISALQASTATRVSVPSGDHALATGDAGKHIDLEEAADQDVTIATGVITAGFQVTLNGLNDTGLKSFVAAAGVTLNGEDGATVSLANNWTGALLLRGIGDDAAVVQGDVA